MEDKAKIAKTLFDPDVSVILSELEDGAKEPSFLSEKLGVTQEEIKTRLAYLIETGFVVATDSPLTYGVNHEKLAKFMENEENYKGVVDGLTELDSYLN